MRIALLHDHFDSDHLAAVQADMIGMGAPTIRAVWMECYGHWAALEGCHRLRAAQALGLTPVITEVEYSEESVDMDGDSSTVEQIADESRNSLILEF